MQTEIKTMTAPAAVEYNTKDFAAKIPCSTRTLKYWRNGRGGNPPKLLPARFEGRQAVYTDAQIETARKLLAQKSAKKNTHAETLPLFDTQPESIDAREEIQQNSEATFEEPVTAETDGSEDAAAELIDPPLGELFNQMPKQQGTRTDLQPLRYVPKKLDDVPKPKLEVAAEIIRPVSKNFLPMTIEPNFAAIPQIMKGLKRFVCWQLQPAEPKAKKIPMTPKNGKLVKADITNPDNWLTFDDALSWYNRRLCTGIGLCLTTENPRICCVDVDHCYTSENTLTDEAQAVIAACSNSFVEFSQSGTGIHVWFCDNEFEGKHGRKKGNVEVYAFKRYIALTGKHVGGTADDLLTANGTCHSVISKFIDRADKGKLFDTEPAQAADTKVAIVNDDDRNNGYDIFRAQCMLKTLSQLDHTYLSYNQWLAIQTACKNIGVPYEVVDEFNKAPGNGGNYNAEQNRRRWEGLKRDPDFNINTIYGIAIKFGYDEKAARHEYYLLHPELKETTQSESTSPLESLKAGLRKAQKKLAEFDARKTAAIEHLRNVETFDSGTVFSEEIISAAAFARLYDRQAFSEFKIGITSRNRKTQDKKVSFSDWLADVKEKVAEIEDEHSALDARINRLRAQIETLKFSATSNELKIPCLPDYQISANGIFKVEGEKLIPVAPRPVVIKSAVKDFHSGNWKFKLAQMTPKGKWKILPTVAASTIANARKIVDLADAGLNVTSGNAAALVEYLANFKTQFEEDLPLTVETPRCGWYEFGGKEMFVAPNRNCVFKDDDEDKIVNVEVSSQSQFAQCLTRRGSLEKWREAYELAKEYPVARFLVAAAVSPPLLKILGERNFSVYTFGKTRGGKTTAQILAASTFGSEKVMRSFDATKNGLMAAAADCNDFAFIVDEKQVADGRLKENLDSLIYSNGNGAGRSRANRDGSAKNISDWRTIGIFSGETELLADTTTGGAHSRLLSLHAPDVIIPPDVCKKIRDLCRENFGHALPRVVDKIQSTGRENLRGYYDDIQKAFAEQYPDVLDEHRRFVALSALADCLLNAVLYGKRDENLLEAIDNAAEIFQLIPTLREIDDTQREIDFVRDFISRNQNQFISEKNKAEYIRGGIFGSLKNEVVIYLAVGVLKDACKQSGFDYGKLVADLIAAGFFVPDDKVSGNQKTPYKFVLKKLGDTPTRCFRINREKF